MREALAGKEAIRPGGAPRTAHTAKPAKLHSQGPSRELGSREHERVIFGRGTVVGVFYFFI